MRYFNVIFDRNYLIQGLTVYRSLQNFYAEDDFVFYPLCMDDISYHLIQKMNISNLVPVHVDELDTPETLKIRKQTTPGQYCWVSQPLICTHLMDKYRLDHITYLESDSLFFHSPEILFKEIGDQSVSLVPHRYTPAYDQTKKSGIYCVQFNYFNNDSKSQTVLQYWKESCFQYNKNAPKKYPGQICLDNWPSHEGVIEVQHLGAGLAPWNVQQYEVSSKDGRVWVNDLPVVFYHYHQFSYYDDGDIDLGYYKLKSEVVELIYKPYLQALDHTKSWVRQHTPDFDYIKTKPKPKNIFELILSPSSEEARNTARKYVRQLIGTYNVFSKI